MDKTKNKKAIDQGDGIVITTTQAEIVLKERDQGNSNEELMTEGLDTGNQETDLELAPTDEETEQKTEDKPINTKLSNGDTDNSMSDPSNDQKSTSEDQVNVVKQNQSDTDTTEIEASLEVPLAHNTVTDPSTPDSTINNAPIESKPDAYKPWMLSLSSGITKARTKYTSTDMIEETYYNNAITDGLGWQFNADLTYRLPKGLTFGTGFGYTQLNASYDYPLNGMSIDTSSFYDYEYDYELIYDTYLSTTIDSSEFVWEVEYVSDSTAYVVDSTLVTTIDTNTTTNTYTGRNKVGYFQIPVSIGTQMQFGKFQLDLFAQTRFNFLIQSNGSLIQDNSLFNYTTSDGIYRPFYMDVMLGMRLHYALFDRLYINANFQYRPVIGSAYQSTTLTKSFDYFHSGVGLSWRF